LTPERWRRITAVFHSARGREAAVRAAYLDEACAQDPTLRGEVEALLAAEAAADGFGDRATFTIEGEAPLAAGIRLGPYRIEALLGLGGMGEVYRAADSRLGRDVALKVLPRQLAADPIRRERLLREARAAAALNHPNICTVHEVGHADGRDYVVFEHIEGQTLATLVRPGGLPADELVDIFLPLAEALAHAHRHGIVHRDIKPANVMVSKLGLPKILDFGVAKGLADSVLDAAPGGATDTGMVIGTVGYMSPEQALGRRVDARTDVFALGCVLHEVASGRRAFDGATCAEVTDAILHRDPPSLGELRPDLPRGLEQIVRRCLRKRPEERYADGSAVARELRELKAKGTAPPSRAGRMAHRVGSWAVSRSARWGGAAALAALAAVIASVVITREAPLPALVRPTQVTVASSVEDYPTWSPDERTLAYESDERGDWDIWLTQFGGAPAVNRTSDHPGDDRYPSWSPDGRQIAFWSDRDGGGYYVLPALGGPAQRVAATRAGPGAPCFSPPQWSSDGSELAYVTYEAAEGRFASWVEIVSIATRDTRRMRLPGAEECRLDLAWSDDGRLLAYVDAAWQIAETTQLRVLRLSDGDSVAVGDDRSNVRAPAWSADGRYLYFTSNRAGPSDLWRQPMSDQGKPLGDARQVTTAVEVRHAGFSASGGRMAFSKGRWVANVWRVPILRERTATWADAEQMTFEQAYIEFVDVSRDGRHLFYSSDRAGNQDLWTKPVEGEPARLTFDPAPEWAPVLSPDGSEVVFYASRSGDREIWVMPAAGGAARQLTRSPGMDSGPGWSPDGRTIVFRSERGGSSDIWAMAADGAGLRQLTDDAAGEYLASVSPDGRWIAFSSNRGGAVGLWRMPAAGGAAERLGVATAAARWSPDGAWLFFARRNGRQGLWGLSVADRRERLIADLGGRRGSLSMAAPATDGRSLYFSWRADVGDIWVMDVGPQ
jgi:Tol biopolymer transport system component